MSRSHSRYPIWRDGRRGGSRLGKRLANKKVRRTRGIHNGKTYRKLFSSYDIVDSKSLDFRWRRKHPYETNVPVESGIFSYTLEWRYDPDFLWWQAYSK